MTIVIPETDLLFQHVKRRHGENAEKQYLEGGRRDALQVSSAGKRLLRREPARVLEFASGFGRVTRHLKTTMPGSDLTASDIHPDACAFIEQNLGIPCPVSDLDPAKLDIGGDYDFIFVLSLFSHLPHKTFGRWMAALYGLLSPGGVLMLTTHGDYARRKFFGGIDLSLEENGDGWVYRRRSDQPDIDAEEYGTMIVTPAYVVGTIDTACPGAVLASFGSGAWLGSQDEWGIIRPL